MRRVKTDTILIASIVIGLILYATFAYAVTDLYDSSIKDESFRVTAKIYNLAYERVNVTVPRFNEYFNILDTLEYPYVVKGYLYIAQPATEWVLTTSYLNILLFFEGFEARYFAGFSIPRIQFILALPDYQKLNITPPPDGEVLVVIDEKYRFRDDPIFDVITDTKWLAFHYPAVLTINMTFTYIYLDTEPLRRDLGIPVETQYDGRSYDFSRSPPIYLLVNRKTYIDILDLTYPKVSGEVMEIEVVLQGFTSYRELLLEIARVLDVVGEGALQVGIEDVRIDAFEFEFLDEELRSQQFRIYSVIFILLVVAAIAIAVTPHIFKRIVRGRYTFYLIMLYPVAIILYTLIFSLQYYVDPAVILIHIVMLLPSMIYISLKSRRRQ